MAIYGKKIAVSVKNLYADLSFLEFNLYFSFVIIPTCNIRVYRKLRLEGPLIGTIVVGARAPAELRKRQKVHGARHSETHISGAQFNL